MTWFYPIFGVLSTILGLAALTIGVKERDTWGARLVAALFGGAFLLLGIWLLLPLGAGISDRLFGTTYTQHLHSYHSMAKDAARPDEPLSPFMMALGFAASIGIAPFAAFVLRRDHPWRAGCILLFIPIGLLLLAPRWLPLLDAVAGTTFHRDSLAAWVETRLWIHPKLLSTILGCEYLWLGTVLVGHWAGLYAGPLTVLLSPFPILIGYECLSSNHRWWSRVLFFIAGAIIGFILNICASIESQVEQTKRNTRAERLFKAVNEKMLAGESIPPFCLYLRPFSTTAKLDAQQRAGPGLDFETILERSLRPRLKLLALGAISEATVLGADRIYVPDDQWWDQFKRLATAAARIVVLPDDSDSRSTRKEIVWLKEKHFLGKCVFLMPETVTGEGWQAQVYLPSTVEVTEGEPTDYHAYWEGTRNDLADIFQIPAYDPRGALFRMSAEGTTIAMAPLGLSHSFSKVNRVRKAFRGLGLEEGTT